jgi:Dyp-type peroxidase family
VIARFPKLELDDIQGNILTGYGNTFAHGTYWFIKFRGSPEQNRRFLRLLADRVTSAAPWTGNAKPLSTLNVAITMKGLDKLGVPKPIQDGFPEDFRGGMTAVAERLGDVGDSRPDAWEPDLCDPELLVTVFARDSNVLEHQNESLRDCIASESVEGPEEPLVATLLSEARLAADADQFRGREHFGFADGFSQPAIRGALRGPPRIGMGTPMRLRRWQLVAPGEFVLGYPGEDGLLQRRPPGPLGNNGSYMVVRKLAQNVKAFYRYLADAARSSPGMPPEGDPGFKYEVEARSREIAGKIVGRWPDGRSLVMSGDPLGVGLVDEMRPQRINNFGYDREDRNGAKCPLGAHVRRANPRDSMGFRGQLTRRHRIIRRSMPYGEPYKGPLDGTDAPADEDNADAPRGLMFICFQASIKRQFELVQAQWLGDGDSFWLGPDQDLLTLGRDRMMLQGAPPRFIPPPEHPFVKTLGGDYFFMPGLAALRALGSAHWR